MIFQNKRIISSVVLITVALTLCSCEKKENGDIPFSSEEWKTSNHTERYHMVSDLETTYELIGMSNSEIKDLLGDYDYGYDPDNNPDNDNYYWGYTIRYDDFEGDEEYLLQFKEDKVICVEKVYLSYL